MMSNHRMPAINSRKMTSFSLVEGFGIGKDLSCAREWSSLPLGIIAC